MTRAVVEVEVVNDGEFSRISEESYLESRSFVWESENLIEDLSILLSKYKNEEHILSGQTIRDEEWIEAEEEIFYSKFVESQGYNPELGKEKNLENFREEYADKLTEVKEKLIKKELREFHALVQKLENYQPSFYASDRSEEHTSELQSRENLVCRLLLEKKKKKSY